MYVQSIWNSMHISYNHRIYTTCITDALYKHASCYVIVIGSPGWLCPSGTGALEGVEDFDFLPGINPTNEDPDACSGDLLQ